MAASSIHKMRPSPHRTNRMRPCDRRSLAAERFLSPLVTQARVASLCDQGTLSLLSGRRQILEMTGARLKTIRLLIHGGTVKSRRLFKGRTAFTLDQA